MHNLLLDASIVIGWLASFVAAVCILAYRRASLRTSTAVLLLLLALYWVLSAAPIWWKVVVSAPFGLLFLVNVRPLRIRLVTRPFMKKYRKLLPAMSATEREALDAGTVWWDGELFTGGPNWHKLMSARTPVLTPVEQAFIDGPAKNCAPCSMTGTLRTAVQTCLRRFGRSSSRRVSLP